MPYKITAIKDTMVTATAQNNHARNSSFFKTMPEIAISLQIEEKEEMNDTVDNQHPPQANHPDIQPVNQPFQPINQQPPTVNQQPQPNRRYPTRQNRRQLTRQTCRFLSWLKPTIKMALDYLD